MIADRLIAHRGWQRRYPENTLLGIAAALDAGAKHVEIDIQLSADQQIFLCHDHLLQRLCNSSLNINHSETAQLSALSVYEPARLGEQFLGTPLSKLADCVALFERHPGSTLYVEIKRQSIRSFGAPAVLKALLPQLKSIKEHCVIISFDIDILQLAVDQGWQQVAPVLGELAQLQASDLTQLNPPLVFCDLDLIREQSIASLGYPLAIYEVDDLQQACQLIDQGAQLIESFAIGELMAAERALSS